MKYNIFNYYIFDRKTSEFKSKHTVFNTKCRYINTFPLHVVHIPEIPVTARSNAPVNTINKKVQIT